MRFVFLNVAQKPKSNSKGRENFKCFQATTNPSIPAHQKSCNLFFPLAHKSYEKEPPAQRVFRIFIASHWKGLLNSSYCLFFIVNTWKTATNIPAKHDSVTNWLTLPMSWGDSFHSVEMQSCCCSWRTLRFSGFIVCFECGTQFPIYSLPPSSCGWSSIERPADTVATYRAGGQLAFTRLNLKLLPSFAPCCCCC